MDIRIEVTHLPRLRENALGFSAAEMLELGQAALPFERLDRGLNRFDQPMDPLSEKYKRRKQRRGRRPIRDMLLSGKLRQAIEVQAAENQASVAVSSQEWRKGYFNQLASQWFGVSPSDADRIDAKVEAINRAHLAGIFVD